MSKNTILAMLLVFTASLAQATPLTYTPVNPSFGGNPANGSVLLNEANAQNGTHAPTKASSAAGTGTNNELTAFINSLQSAILDRLSSSIVSEIIGPTGKLIPGVLDTTNFRITVTDLGNGSVEITTLSKATNQTSTFDVSQGN
jgi:curli production assembly/transport component CsgF